MDLLLLMCMLVVVGALCLGLQIILFINLFGSTIRDLILNYLTNSANQRWVNYVRKQGLPDVDAFTVPIFFINLKRSPYRRARMEHSLSYFNTSLTRIDAVDGKNLHSHGDNLFEVGGIYAKCTFLITINELACTLSHLKAISEAKRQNLDHVLILEDDVVFDLVSMWPKGVLNTMLGQLPKNAGILQLYWGRSHESSCKFDGDDYAVRPINVERPCWGNVAYIVTRKGMDDILNYTGDVGANAIDNPILLTPHDGQRVTSGISDILLFQLTPAFTTSIPLISFDNLQFGSTIQESPPGMGIAQQAIMDKYLRMAGKRKQPRSTSDGLPCYENVMTLEEEMTLRKLLEVWRTTASELGIRWAACAGSELGARRHEGRIPWDDDFDIMVHKDDVDKLSNVSDNIPINIRYHRDAYVDKMRRLDKLYFTDFRGTDTGHGTKWPFIDVFVADKLEACAPFDDAEMPLVDAKFDATTVPLLSNPGTSRPLDQNTEWKTVAFDTGYRHRLERGLMTKCAPKPWTPK
jgi:GR25 family glycosyltransferase involved in LPS biosynthesis